MTASEFYYTDGHGRRIPNLVSGMKTILLYFRLNTPPPVMSYCPAPPARPDPFRSGPYPTRDLGCATWMKEHNYCSRAKRPRYKKSKKGQEVIQLTPEEDQAITSLLTLHYQQHVPTDGLPVQVIEKDLHQNGGSSVTNVIPDHQIPLSHTPLDQSAVAELTKASYRDGPLHSVAVSGGERHLGRMGSSAEMDAAYALLSLGGN